MRLKCCVGGCNATSETQQLFTFPKNDKLRNLWMSFLVPYNTFLIGLTKEQLLKKRVCKKHFDKYQFDGEGKRLRYSYPCLFTDDEVTHGEPFPAAGTVRDALSDHNYFKDHDDEEDITATTLVIGRPVPAPVCSMDWTAVEPVASTSKTPLGTATTQNIPALAPISDDEAASSAPVASSGKTQNNIMGFSCEAKLQGETHKDHTYDVTDRTIVTVGTQRTLEKCIDTEANRDAKSTQIEAAPEIEPVPELEEVFDPDYELQVSPSPSPLPELDVEDSGGEAVFSWQREEELIEADDPSEPPAPPADPTLALFCESDPEPDDANGPKADADADPDIIFDPQPDPQPDQAVPSVPAPVDNRCKDCGEVNTGFEFWCVQCAGGALCGACAGRAPHHAHYVLRAPMGCSRARTQAVLTMIRQQAVLISISQQLQNQNLSQRVTVDDDLKLELKEEPAEAPPAAPPAAEPDPLACEPGQPGSPDETREPELPHHLIEPVESISLHSPRSSSRSSQSPPPSPISLPSCPASPRSPLSPRSPPPSRTSRPAPRSLLKPPAPAASPEPAVTPEPATHKADKNIAGKIVDHRQPLPPPRLRKPFDAQPLQPPRLRKPPEAHETSTPAQRKLVKVSPAEVKRAFLSHIERVVTTQNKQLKAFQPHAKPTPQVRENVVTTQHEGPTCEGSSRTTRLQARGQAPMKVTSEPRPSKTVTIDLDVADETLEYLEEGLDSDIETVDNVDHGDDVLDEDFDDDVLDEDYLLDEGDLEEAELEEADLDSYEERMVRNVPGRGVKRKKEQEETLPVKGPSESMVRAFPTKAVIKVRPLSSLEISNWTANRKRLRKD